MRVHGRIASVSRTAYYVGARSNGFPSPTKFFEPFGWREVEFRSASDEARRLKREMRGAWFWRLVALFSPAEKREQYRRMSGFVLLGRQSATMIREV
jgi:hypothetical protein